jgi:hypothetical protein
MMAKYLAVLTLALCLASAAAFVPSASFKLGSPALAGRCALAPALRQVPPQAAPHVHTIPARAYRSPRCAMTVATHRAA